MTLYAGEFSTPMVFGGQNTGCILRQSDEQASVPGLDLTVQVTEIGYASATLVPEPTIGSTVTVTGVSYLVRDKKQREAGVTHLWLTALP